MLVFIVIAAGAAIALYIAGNFAWALLRFLWAVIRAIAFIVTLPYRLLGQAKGEDHG